MAGALVIVRTNQITKETWCGKYLRWHGQLFGPFGQVSIHQPEVESWLPPAPTAFLDGVLKDIYGHVLFPLCHMSRVFVTYNLGRVDEIIKRWIRP